MILSIPDSKTRETNAWYCRQGEGTKSNLDSWAEHKTLTSLHREGSSSSSVSSSEGGKILNADLHAKNQIQ